MDLYHYTLDNKKNSGHLNDSDSNNIKLLSIKYNNP